MAKSTIAIIGASKDRSKFGNKAVRAYRDKGWEVYPVHPSEPKIEGITAYKTVHDIPVERLDRVSFYLPPEVGIKVLRELDSDKVREVWLNPGSESDQILEEATDLGLSVIAACSIVDIGTSPSNY